MSKAEEKAMEKYPPRSILIVPARRGGYYADSHMREGFIEGYHQAEKELELTVDDIKNIDRLLNQCVDYSNPYQEVLKRFKERKENKNKRR